MEAIITEVPAIQWPGLSGRKYVYWIYDIGTIYAPAPGNFIFIKEVEPYMWEPVYVGQTADLHEIPFEEYTRPCIRLHGATHVCVHESSDYEDARLTEVSDIIKNYHPVCNNNSQTEP